MAGGFTPQEFGHKFDGGCEGEGTLDLTNAKFGWLRINKQSVRFPEAKVYASFHIDFT